MVEDYGYQDSIVFAHKYLPVMVNIRNASGPQGVATVVANVIQDTRST